MFILIYTFIKKFLACIAITQKDSSGRRRKQWANLFWYLKVNASIVIDIVYYSFNLRIYWPLIQVINTEFILHKGLIKENLLCFITGKSTHFKII